MTLKELQKGKTAVIKKVGGEGALRQHFLDMGVLPGAEVQVVKYAPMGDPVEILIHGYRLTLRLSEAEKISVLNSMTEGAEYQLKDNRDQTMYYIAKLADGNIWMTQNLDLELSTEKTLTPADTNITADWTPANSTISFTGTSVPGWQDDFYVPYSADPGPLYVYSSGTTSNDEQYTSLEACKEAHSDCSAKNHAGNYYNWSAAVASNDTSSLSTQYANAPGSICPAGWRLPTGRDSNDTAASREWNAVLYAEGVASSRTGNGYKSGGFNKIRRAPLWLARSGYVGGVGGGGSLVYTGYNGYYWSSTVYDSFRAFGLDFGSSNVLSSRSISRVYGHSVRCVAQ